MVGIDFERAKRRLPRELFLAMQSVPEEEAAQVSRPIDEIDRMDDLSSQGQIVPARLLPARPARPA